MCGIISKPALIPWAVNATIDVVRAAIGPGAEYSETYLEEVFRAAKQASGGIKKDAASKGTEIHKAVEALLGGSEGNPELPGYQAAAGLQLWLQSLGARVIEIERRIYSRRYRYSGTLDAIVAIDGRLVLLDWKSGKSIYPEYYLQTAAYVKAYEEETGFKIDKRILVKVGDEITPTECGRESLRRDFAAFLGAKQLFDRISYLSKKK